jgi:hypothetical protein
MEARKTRVAYPSTESHARQMNMNNHLHLPVLRPALINQSVLNPHRKRSSGVFFRRHPQEKVDKNDGKCVRNRLCDMRPSRLFWQPPLGLTPCNSTMFSPVVRASLLPDILGVSGLTKCSSVYHERMISIGERKIMESATQSKAPFDKIIKNLQEREKELNCLYNVEEILNTTEDVKKALQAIITVIPPGWQYPEYCQVSIRHLEQEYHSPKFWPTE